MIIQENPAAARELVQRANAHQQTLEPRAAGLHVSDLIYCRRKAWYRARARAAGIELEEYDTDTLVMFLLGHGYHALMEQGIEERRLQLRIKVKDGLVIIVHGTADHIERDDEGEFPNEYKTTRASVNKPIESVQHYIEQDASYALTMGVKRARLSVVYINGAYNKNGAGMKPTMKCYDLEFTDAELEAWHKELTRRTALLSSGQEPNMDEHRKWECGYCPFNAKIGGPCPATGGNERHFFLLDSTPDFLDNVLHGT